MTISLSTLIERNTGHRDVPVLEFDAKFLSPDDWTALYKAHTEQKPSLMAPRFDCIIGQKDGRIDSQRIIAFDGSLRHVLALQREYERPGLLPYPLYVPHAKTVAELQMVDEATVYMLAARKLLATSLIFSAPVWAAEWFKLADIMELGIQPVLAVNGNAIMTLAKTRVLSYLHNIEGGPTLLNTKDLK